MMKEIAPNIYVSTDYPNVNVGFIVGPNGVVAVDAPTLPEDALEWRGQIEEAAQLPLLYTVVTDPHPHRLLCAGLLDAPIIASQTAYRYAADYTDGFWRSVVRSLKRRFSEQEDALDEVNAVLPEILFNDRLTIHKGGFDLSLKRINGNAPGNIWIDLRDAGVLFVGDTVTAETPPLMAETPDTRAWLDTLTMLRRPRFSDLTLVPGRGPICDVSATQTLSEYIRIARRRIRSLHSAGDAKGDVTEFIDELLALYTVPEEQEDRLRRRIKNGLERVYEEMMPEDEEE